MMDKALRQDLEGIKGTVKGDVFEGKSVLVTGGAGFIGSWLCDVLVDLGAKVTAVDDLSTGKAVNIEHLISNGAFTFIKADVCTFQSKEQFDFILHMAGHAAPDEYQAHPIEALKTSAIGSFNMSELARKSDAALLFASTSEVYGDTDVIPTPETHWGKVNPVGPRSCYDEGKRFAEALMVAYSKQHGLEVRIPRIFNSYGPRLREDGLYGRALSRFILQALTNKPITVYGEGKQTRSFCYVTDTVTALMLLLSAPGASGQVVNVGSTDEVSILDLAKKIQRATGSRSTIEFHPLPEDDPKRRCPDISKLKRITNWEPRVTLEEGLKRMVSEISKDT